ncbi:MAG: BolA family transcriptional regulator [Nevskiales bacterium]|nr:BolA family transcriptional regulator [Nevskiales bacterium]
MTAETATRVERIRDTLAAAFAPTQLVIEDESHLHAGHAGARSGKGHFRIEIESEAFRGLGPLQRHRAVYAALDALMQTDIHALSIKATPPPT